MKKKLFRVCHGFHCKPMGKYILEAAEKELAESPCENISVESCGCQGNCTKGPTVVFVEEGKEGVYFNYMYPEKIIKLIKKEKHEKKQDFQSPRGRQHPAPNHNQGKYYRPF